MRGSKRWLHDGSESAFDPGGGCSMVVWSNACSAMSSEWGPARTGRVDGRSWL